MNIKKTLDVLCMYNKWRNGADIVRPSSDEITEAINNAIDYIENNEKLKD